MTSSRYREARTLVRRLCRLPGEDPADFRRKVKRLKRHFEQFNLDVSAICQWMMSLRPKDGEADQGVPAFWHFFLEPQLDDVEADEKERDRWRLAVFDVVVGIRAEVNIRDKQLTEPLLKAMRQVAQHPRKLPAERLFARMRELEPEHRLVLLKAAAEWVVARYQRGIENWERQREEWEKEKQAWEAKHPTLTEDIRQRFTEVFKQLVEPDGDGSPGLQRKNPRLCLHERLREGKDNCVYAGEEGHGPLCSKYATFVLERRRKNSKFNEKHFGNAASEYIRYRKSSDRTNALQELYKEIPQCKRWFEKDWKAYLDAMELEEETVLKHGELPHCR